MATMGNLINSLINEDGKKAILKGITEPRRLGREIVQTTFYVWLVMGINHQTFTPETMFVWGALGFLDLNNPDPNVLALVPSEQGMDAIEEMHRVAWLFNQGSLHQAIYIIDEFMARPENQVDDHTRKGWPYTSNLVLGTMRNEAARATTGPDLPQL